MISRAMTLPIGLPAEAARRAGNTARFTLDGSDALEERLAAICRDVSDGVSRVVPQPLLEGILLGGGYGRGEGGVLKGPNGDLPYNDMEFYVFLRGNRFLNERRFVPPLSELAHRLSAEANVEVELKVLSFRKLRASGPSMFYYDLVMGHRWVAGHEGLLSGTEHHRHGADIPLHEATRLLINRCSGLLFARELLDAEQWSPESADFVGRNIAKTQLALGDAVLTAAGGYHWSCRERNRRLNDLVTDAPETRALRQYHDEAVSFKLNPVKSAKTREQLRYRHDDVALHAYSVFLWIESKRLQNRFADAQSYAMSEVNKCPETNALRNALVNIRAFGAEAAGRTVFVHPRERILNAMALLLWTPGLGEPRLADRLKRMLRTNASTFREAVEAYRRLWRRFN